jgi:hypothetical protein
MQQAAGRGLGAGRGAAADERRGDAAGEEGVEADPRTCGRSIDIDVKVHLVGDLGAALGRLIAGGGADHRRQKQHRRCLQPRHLHPDAF